MNWIQRLIAQVPSGETSDEVEAYYQYLYEHYLRTMPTSNWTINWGRTPMQLATGAAATIIFFYFFAQYFGQPLRPGEEMYGVQSFGGILTERNGKAPLFSLLTWIAIYLWGMYYVIEHIITGQVY